MAIWFCCPKLVLSWGQNRLERSKIGPTESPRDPRSGPKQQFLEDLRRGFSGQETCLRWSKWSQEWFPHFDSLHFGPFWRPFWHTFEITVTFPKQIWFKRVFGKQNWVKFDIFCHKIWAKWGWYCALGHAVRNMDCLPAVLVFLLISDFVKQRQQRFQTSKSI